MTNIMLCSELGSGSRHLEKLADYAVELEAQGFTVQLVCNDLVAANQLPEFDQKPIFQAPVFQDEKHKVSLLDYHSVSARGAAANVSRLWSSESGDNPLLNYSSILLNNGYQDTASLTALLKAWLQLHENVGADIVIADHAPTAVLAAKLLKIPCIMTGDGYSVPPLTEPLATITPWRNISADDLYDEDREVVKVVNAVISDLGFLDAQIQNVKEIFEYAAQWIMSVPELDYYGSRNQPYIGRWNASTQRAAPKWPSVKGDKIFVFMQAESRFVRPLIEQLNLLNLPTLAVVPGISQGLIDLYAGTSLKIQREQVNLNQVAEEANIYINCADHDMVFELLSLGAASVFLPHTPQQKMFAHRVVAKGLGFMGQDSPDKLNIAETIAATRIQNQVWQNAAHLSVKYQDHTLVEKLNSLIKRELVAKEKTNSAFNLDDFIAAYEPAEI